MINVMLLVLLKVPLQEICLVFVLYNSQKMSYYFHDIQTDQQAIRKVIIFNSIIFKTRHVHKCLADYMNELTKTTIVGEYIHCKIKSVCKERGGCQHRHNLLCVWFTNISISCPSFSVDMRYTH